MPNIEEIKKKKNTKPTKKLIRTKTPKLSPVDYYNCLLTSAQNDWFDSATGKKKKITTCCKDCKSKAPVLNQVREQELHKLITSYKQVGDSLTKLLKPIK